MTTLNSPHDRFFKAVFGRTEVAAEFLERYLPAEVAATVQRLRHYGILAATGGLWIDGLLFQSWLREMVASAPAAPGPHRRV